MKKLLVSAIAVMLTGSVFAQKAEDLKNNWEMTIPVKTAQSTTLDKLFTAWADVNPGDFVNIYKKYKKAPAENIDGYQVNYHGIVQPGISGRGCHWWRNTGKKAYWRSPR